MKIKIDLSKCTLVSAEMISGAVDYYHGISGLVCDTDSCSVEIYDKNNNLITLRGEKAEKALKYFSSQEKKDKLRSWLRGTRVPSDRNKFDEFLTDLKSRLSEIDE